jgi:hypothetical protein
MATMPGATNRRVPGGRMRAHINAAMDLVGQAIEAVDFAASAEVMSERRHDALVKAKSLYGRALEHCRESTSETAPICAAACVAAIDRLDLAIARPGRTVDLSVALKPDLGQASAKARREAAVEEAHIEAAKCEAIVRFNRRRHGGDIALLELAVARLKPGGSARAMALTMLDGMLSGRRRGYDEKIWAMFMSAARRERVSI